MIWFHRKKGFTLLELMIVVIIIGILASLAIPRFIRATMRATAAEAVTNLGMLRSAEWRYYAENSSFTNVFGNLDIDDPNKVAKIKFTYTIPTASSTALSLKAEYKADTTKYITMDQDGTKVESGF